MIEKGVKHLIRGYKMAKCSDRQLLKGLNDAWLETKTTKQLKLDRKSKPSPSKKEHFYDFGKLRASLVEQGVTMTDQAIRQRVYAVNKGLKDSHQSYKAKRKEGLTRKAKDFSMFLRA